MAGKENAWVFLLLFCVSAWKQWALLLLIGSLARSSEWSHKGEVM